MENLINRIDYFFFFLILFSLEEPNKFVRKIEIVSKQMESYILFNYNRTEIIKLVWIESIVIERRTKRLFVSPFFMWRSLELLFNFSNFFFFPKLFRIKIKSKFYDLRKKKSNLDCKFCLTKSIKQNSLDPYSK